MQLKPYQDAALTTLRDFLARAQEIGPAAAYAEITARPAIRERLGRYARAYTPPSGLENVPYVCIRLPTGGGKTLLAAETVRVARDASLNRDYPLVLWLVTSTAIRAQTADALNDHRHPYRAALNEAFGGNVRVFDIADFAQVRPQDLAGNACIIVGTVQALKVENTEGRKVYAHHEEMEAHFSRLPSALLDAHPDLERDTAGKVKFSFANLLHLNRPLMIVDEAHNVVTGLSDMMRQRVNPSAVVEFTATPRGRSNILFNATAAELKAEQMIKLPIVLQEHASWQGAVAGAVEKRAALAKLAEADRDYIRPVTLYQAEPKDREVTVEVLKQHLIDDCNVPEDRIVVVTGDQRGLDGIDLRDPACKIEHVITVQALKEGWDCPFAYVFCSVAGIRSATAVEQLLGRVLRMPYANRRKAMELNKAYAHVSEPTFYAAATALKDALIDMGFEDGEAEEAIEHPQLPLGEGLLFDPAPEPFRFEMPDTPEVRAVYAAAGIAPVASADGGIVLTAASAATPGLAAALMQVAPTAAAALAPKLAQLAPAARGEVMRVPRLMTEVQGELVLADLESLFEFHDWKLADKPFDVPGLVDALTETVNRFELDVHGGRVTFGPSGSTLEMFSDSDVEGWTPQFLTVWLDRQIVAWDLAQADRVSWFSAVIERLSRDHGLTVLALMRMKYVLARRLKSHIDALRETERRGVAQQYLFAPTAPVRTLASENFEFRLGMYDDQSAYRGGERFSNHFLDRVPAFDGKDGGEEQQCARMLDSLRGVKWWVRNVAKHPNSFWLQTSKDRTYPDFIAELDDGQIFVVEYKGADRWADAAEDRAIGAAWERAGGGLYLMVGKRVDNLDMLGQLRRKLGRT
ncbi:DEAD/DEAH box helicase [Brevundimonas sp. SL161]|uniref:DEAD/DEAH box helicase n=1 Tax=Brevundimonas sp. SL161 TaxID=2804613 RepID=UPI003CFBB5C1